LGVILQIIFKVSYCSTLVEDADKDKDGSSPTSAGATSSLEPLLDDSVRALMGEATHFLELYGTADVVRAQTDAAAFTFKDSRLTVDHLPSRATLQSFESLSHALVLLCFESESDITRTYTEKALRLLCIRSVSVCFTVVRLGFQLFPFTSGATLRSGQMLSVLSFALQVLLPSSCPSHHPSSPHCLSLHPSFLSSFTSFLP
jgi:hypothetical protein